MEQGEQIVEIASKRREFRCAISITIKAHPDFTALAPPPEGEVTAAHQQGPLLLSGEEHRLGMEPEAGLHRYRHDTVANAKISQKMALARIRFLGTLCVGEDGERWIAAGAQC